MAAAILKIESLTPMATQSMEGEMMKSRLSAIAGAVLLLTPSLPAVERVPQEEIHAIWQNTPQRQREIIKSAYKGLKTRCFSPAALERLKSDINPRLQGVDLKEAKKRGQLKAHRLQAPDPFMLTTVLCAFWLNQDVGMANEFLAAAISSVVRTGLSRNEGGFAVYQHAGGPSREALLYLHCKKDASWAGRLTPDLEKQMLDYFWRWIYRNSQIAYPKAPRIENVWLDTWQGLGEGSENHRTTKWNALFLVLTALAGDPAYADRKLEDGATVKEHLAAWTDYLDYRVREWARKGLFGEFGKAGGYGLGHIEPLYSLRDFATSPELRKLADDLLTVRIADWTMHMIGPGYVGGSTIRSYKAIKTQHYAQSHLYFGFGETDELETKEPYPFFSDYRPPAILVDIAWNRAAAGPCEYRMKPSGVVGWGSFFYGRDNVKLKPGETNAPTAGPSFPTPTLRYAYVTPGYVLGSFTQDPTRDPTFVPDLTQPPKDQWGVGFQDIIMGATFPTGYQLMPYCREPHHSGFGEFRAVADRSVLIVQRNPDTKSGDLGVYFPIELYETKREEDGWVFARDPNGTAFVAVKPAKGGTAGWEPLDMKPENPKEKTIRGQWLKFTEKNAPIVIQMGLAGDYESFISKVKACRFQWSSETEFEYAGCGDAHPIVWNTNRRYLPMIGGVPINIYPPHVYRSPYLESVYDSGIVTLRDTTGKTLVLDFNKPLK